MKRKRGDSMHSYLRAVGFSNIRSRSNLEKIVGIIMQDPLEKKTKKIDDKIVLTEMKKNFSNRMGIGIVGEYDEKGFFHLDHYFPYYQGEKLSSKEEVVVNKRVDTDAYTCMCDDLRLGVSLIFYLQNIIDYVEYKDKMNESSILAGVTLSALSIEGKILLGINQNEQQIKNKTAETLQRKKLISEAKMGNQEAIDSLTIEDIDTYAMVSRRVKHEDIYTIVENSFIPYGSESDNYSIIGNIVKWELETNQYTGEEVYELLVNCNDLTFNICINKADLQGIPMKNSRFKGNIWMQGRIHFPN